MENCFKVLTAPDPYVCPSDLKETIFPLVSAPPPVQTLRLLNGKCDTLQEDKNTFF